jgi:hypothetical protein
MYKVFAFLKRNTALLTHDEYRAGHVGFHCSHSRRLKGIRGYCVNVRGNGSLADSLGSLYGEITRDEPSGFAEQWDGFPEVYFDDWESWSKAATVEPTRATADGLSNDPDWRLDDGPFLFDPVPDGGGEFRSHHLHMEEHTVIPVQRPEYKLTKFMQFYRKNPALSDADFQAGVLERYAKLSKRLNGLHGYTVNFRDPDQESAMRDFFSPQSWGFSEEGKVHRQAFCALWDGAAELFFDSVDAFAAARADQELHAELCALEQELFEAVWYVEVDENIIVMPNRDPAPDFYYR